MEATYIPEDRILQGEFITLICEESLPYVHSLLKLSLYRPWRPLGLREVEDPTIFRQSAHRGGRGQGCQPYAPAALYPQEDFWYSFLLEAESTPGP
jgi:hypothetical protein